MHREKWVDLECSERIKRTCYCIGCGKWKQESLLGLDLENGWVMIPFTEILEGWKRNRFEGHEIESLVLGKLSLRDRYVSGDVLLVICV